MEQEGRFGEGNSTQDGKHLGCRGAVVEGDVPERPRGHEGGADRKPCGNRKL